MTAPEPKPPPIPETCPACGCQVKEVANLFGSDFICLGCGRWFAYGRRGPWVLPHWATIGGWLLIAIGLLTIPAYSEGRYHRDRFDGSYAPGATANAVERLAAKQGEWAVRPGELLIAGTLLLIFGRLSRRPPKS